MNIISSDTNFTDDENENNRYNEKFESSSHINKALKPLKEEQANEATTESSEISKDRVKNVAEKVKGVTISKTHLHNNIVDEYNIDSSDNSNVIETTDDPEIVVRDLEARHLRRLKMEKLPPQAREILLLTASLHIREGVGITVRDLEKIGLGKHNAEKQLQDARRNGLLIPGNTRNGKHKQYYLSNYKYTLDEKVKRKNKDEYKDIAAAVAATDMDITLQLLQLLSNRKYTYHNIHLETNLCYDDDYESLGWYIPSPRNKQKVMTFNLELNRKCSITVSPTKTTSISFQCTRDPFQLHTPSGLMEFIGSCG